MSNARLETPPFARTPIPAAMLRPVSALARRALTLVAGWRNRREIVRLATFDDRLLRDIGLTRADVDWALLQPRGVDPSEALAVRVERRRAATRWARRLTA